MGVGDALDIYDRIKEAERQRDLEAYRHSFWGQVENWVGLVFFAIIVFLIIYFIVHKIKKIHREEKQYKASKLASKQAIQQGTPVPTQQYQPYSFTAVGVLNVVSIVPVSNYRELMCHFQNDTIGFDLRLADTGQYNWLSEGSSVQVHLAKDQFTYYINPCKT